MLNPITQLRTKIQQQTDGFRTNPVQTVQQLSQPFRQIQIATSISAALPGGQQILPKALLSTSVLINQGINGLACTLYNPTQKVPGNYRIVPALFGLTVHGLSGLIQGTVSFLGAMAATASILALFAFKLCAISLAALLIYMPYKLLNSKTSPSSTLNMMPIPSTESGEMPEKASSSSATPLTPKQIEAMQTKGMI